MFDTTALMTIRSQSFIQPLQPGHELINVTDVGFLIEHQASGKKVLFDLGVRKDYWNLPVTIQKRLGDVIPSLSVDKDATEILEEKGIPLKSICEFPLEHLLLLRKHTTQLSLPASVVLESNQFSNAHG